MGMKFKNINIQGADISEIQKLCPEDEVKQFVPGWITLTAELFDWDSVHDVAKQLSKKLPYAVLSTDYFDDSYVEFVVYRNGKRVARHIPDEYDGFPRRPGSCKGWIESLGLAPDAEQPLRLIFREQNPEVCLHLLACVLNCVLWVEYKYTEYARMPEPQYLQEYIDRKNKEKKIRNKTKLTLLEELPGQFWWEDYPVRRGVPGHFMDTCWIIQDGHIQEIDLKQHPLLLNGAYLDQKHFFDNGRCIDPETKQMVWTLRTGRTPFNIPDPVFFPDGRFATIFYVDCGSHRSSRLTSFRADGSEMITEEFPEEHTNLAAHGEQMYYAAGKALICCDSMLRELWRMDLGFRSDDSGKLFYDEKTKLLYYGSYFHAATVDPVERRIVASRRFADHEDYYCRSYFPGLGLIMQTGESSFQVWDQKLQMIARHRTKGYIQNFVQTGQRHYVVTNTDAVENAQLRLYELTLPK